MYGFGDVEGPIAVARRYSLPSSKARRGSSGLVSGRQDKLRHRARVPARLNTLFVLQRGVVPDGRGVQSLEPFLFVLLQFLSQFVPCRRFAGGGSA